MLTQDQKWPIVAMFLLFAVITLSILLVGTQESLDKFHAVECDYSILSEESPETLVAPNSIDFKDQESYENAYKDFLEFGTWATLLDGYNCKK